MNDPMRAVCYYRHSTDNAQQDANSIPDQRRNCRLFATRLGWDIIEEVEDKGQSGAGDKKNLMDLADRASSGKIKFDVLLIREQARVTRKNAFRIMEDIEWLEATNIKISCVDDNDHVPLTIDDWAQDPARLIKTWSNNQAVLDAGKRSVSGLLTAHAEGRLSWVGRTPSGFDKVEGKIPDGAKPNGKPFMVLQANSDLKIVTDMFSRFVAGESLRSLVTVTTPQSLYQSE